MRKKQVLFNCYPVSSLYSFQLGDHHIPWQTRPRETGLQRRKRLWPFECFAHARDDLGACEASIFS